jgi:hypothetical protein
MPPWGALSSVWRQRLAALLHAKFPKINKKASCRRPGKHGELAYRQSPAPRLVARNDFGQAVDHPFDRPGVTASPAHAVTGGDCRRRTGAVRAA